MRAGGGTATGTATDMAEEALARWRVPRPGWFFLWGSDLVVLLIAGALAAAVCLSFVAARTVYYLDSGEVCAVALLPAEAALLATTVPGAWWAARFDRLFDKGGLALLNALAGVILLLVMLPVNAALSLNQWGDRSAAAPQRLLVLDRAEHSGRHGRRSYTVSVAPRAPRPLPEGSSWRIPLFDGPKAVAVTQAEYEQATPGRSTLTLRLHPGLFGFAWFEDGARLEP